jgi:archaellum component FlaC
MNFEEKVLTMLENQNEAINGLKEDVSGLKADVSRLNKSVSIMEVEHGKSLGALHDGYKFMYDEIKYMKPIVENTAKDVEIIKSVVTKHSNIFSVLKSAI